MEGTSMLIETERLMPITKLQKELTQTVRKIAESNEAVYILKNNNMEAVMLPFSHYEYLSALEEAFERMEIADTIHSRMKKYNPDENVSWDAVKGERRGRRK